MAERLTWWRSEWGTRQTINQNADSLETVEDDVAAMHGLLQKQTAELQKQGADLLWLRSMVMGLLDVLHARGGIDDAELKRAVDEAWTKLTTSAT